MAEETEIVDASAQQTETKVADRTTEAKPEGQQTVDHGAAERLKRQKEKAEQERDEALKKITDLNNQILTGQKTAEDNVRLQGEITKVKTLAEIGVNISAADLIRSTDRDGIVAEVEKMKSVFGGVPASQTTEAATVKVETKVAEALQQVKDPLAGRPTAASLEQPVDTSRMSGEERKKRASEAMETMNWPK